MIELIQLRSCAVSAPLAAAVALIPLDGVVVGTAGLLLRRREQRLEDARRLLLRLLVAEGREVGLGLVTH